MIGSVDDESFLKTQLFLIEVLRHLILIVDPDDPQPVAGVRIQPRLGRFRRQLFGAQLIQLQPEASRVIDVGVLHVAGLRHTCFSHRSRSDRITG